jgi:hypothetical protein
VLYSCTVVRMHHQLRLPRFLMVRHKNDSIIIEIREKLPPSFKKILANI